MASCYLNSRNPIGPSGVDSCVATAVSCFPGFFDSSFNTELLKILLISQSWESVLGPRLEHRSRHAFRLVPGVISSSVFRHGFLFHRLAVIFHSHPSRLSSCAMKGAFARPQSPLLKSRTWLVFMAHCNAAAGIIVRSPFHKENVCLVKWRQIITNKSSCINWSLDWWRAECGGYGVCKANWK